VVPFFDATLRCIKIAVPMTDGTLQNMATAAQERWGLSKVAIAHRTGRVNVGEASVIICTSSPHRAAAIASCQWLIDELKAIVPIWKREYFEDGSVWKENEEAKRLLVHAKHHSGSQSNGKSA
jgi:molybdopterin synthase catalytic subunit